MNLKLKKTHLFPSKLTSISLLLFELMTLFIPLLTNYIVNEEKLGQYKNLILMISFLDELIHQLMNKMN